MNGRFFYFFFFILLAMLACFFAFEQNLYTLELLLLWVTLTCVFLASAYLWNRSDWLCGKKPSGQVSVICILINFPWLAFTWIIWVLTSLMSREPPINQVSGTNLYISRFPLWGIDLSQFDWIIDLTAEFPRFYSPPKQYLCLPNLDGIELRNIDITQNIDPDSKILVHCAQGHGRSATFASIFLAREKIFTTPMQAYHAVTTARPNAKASSSQIHQLKTRFQTMSR